MGSKLVKYDDGGWLMLRAVMDNELYEMLGRNINILGYRDKERFEGVDFPQPASQETMDMLKEVGLLVIIQSREFNASFR